MLVALFSDVHGFDPALKALEDDLSDLRIDGKRRKLDALWCLGDLVGYGPYPISVLRRLQRWFEEPQSFLKPTATRLCLRGNHDDGLLKLANNEPLGSQIRLGDTEIPAGDGFNFVARAILGMHLDFMRDEAYADSLQWLRERPVRATPLPGYHLAHGKYTEDDHKSIWEYGTKNESERDDQMAQLRQSHEPVRFTALGHLHIGGLWQSDGTTLHEKDIFSESWHTLTHLSQQPVLLNCGTISLPHEQPGYPCTMYVLLDIIDEETVRVQFRRLHFSIDSLVGDGKPIHPGYPGYDRLKARLEAAQNCTA